MAARTVLLNIIGNDRVTGTLRAVRRELDGTADAASNLAKAGSALNKVGFAASLATGAGAATALTKALVPAVGALAALPAAASGAAAAMYTMKLALTGVGDALGKAVEGDTEKFEKALADLSPMAQKVTKELGDALLGLRINVQDAFFGPVTRESTNLGKLLRGPIQAGMTQVAASMGRVGARFVQTAREGESMRFLQGLFRQTASALDGIAVGVPNLVRGFRDLAAVFLGDFTRAGASIGNLLSRFGLWMSKIAQGGQATAWVRNAVGTFTQLGAIARNLAIGLGGVVGASGAFTVNGRDMLTVVEQLTAGFARWSQSAAGQQQATQTFQALGQIATEVAHILPLLLGPLGAIAKTMTTLPQPVRDVVTQMLAWSIVIGVVAKQLRVLLLVTTAWTAATKAATIAMTALRLAFGATGVAGFIAGLRNVNVAMAASATFAQRLGAAIRAQIILWRAQAAAAGVSTARIIAQAAAQRVAAAATKVWAAAQWLWNAAMTANPIGLIIVGIVALGAALVLAYKKSETFRNIVNAAFNGIKVAVAVAWNFIKPIFNIYKWYIVNVLGTALKWYWAYVKFVWNTVSMVVMAAWNFIKPVFMAIANFLRGTLRVAFVVIQNVVKVVWIAIQVYIKVAWTAIKAYFTAMKWYISNVLAPIFRWLWNSVIKPVWNGIKANISANWRAIKAIWAAIRTYLIGPLMAAFRTARSVATSVWNALKNSIASVYNGGIKPVFDRLRSALGTVRSAFSTAVSAIRRIWDGLKSAAKTPVNFVIGVYNRGIVSLVNKLADFAGVKTRLNNIPQLARGGTLDNPLPAKPFMTNGPLAIVGEGRKQHPEYVIPTDPRFRSRAQMLWAAAGKDLGTEGPDAKWLRGKNRLGGEGIAFERGGSLQKLAFGGIIGDFVKGVKNFTIGNVEKGARVLLDKVLGGNIPGSGVFRNIVAGIPGWIKRTVLGWIKNKVASFGGGPGMQRALAWAKTQSGKPYQWGGNGNPSWDCSGFMSAIESVIRGQKPHRRWSTHPFHGGAQSPMPGWHRNQKSGFMIGVTGAGVGHTAGTLLGHNVESSGSGGVRVGGGARGFNNGMFPHRYGLKFDRGGLLPEGWSQVYNGTGRPEPVFPTLEHAAAAVGRDGGPLVTIGEVVVKERADVDLVASRIGFAARAASF
jgi:phage-related protein